MKNNTFHQLRNPMRNCSKFGSDFCKWVYEHCASDFYFGNIDGIAFKKSTNILRVFEWKHTNEILTPGQRAILPILDRMIQRAIDSGALAIGSGVYVIYGNPPFERASVYRFGERNPTKMTAEELKLFVACKPKEEIPDIEVLDVEIVPLDKNGKKLKAGD